MADMEAYAKAVQAKATEGKRQPDRARTDGLPPKEKLALATLRREAKAKGTTLLNGGRGGLPPSMVLNVLRRADYACEYGPQYELDRAPTADDLKHRCGSRKDITIHHKGGIPADQWLSRIGHKSVPANLAVLCAKHHNLVHEEARKRGVDSTQVMPAGDEGTRRDKGLPVAHPNH